MQAASRTTDSFTLDIYFQKKSYQSSSNSPNYDPVPAPVAEAEQNYRTSVFRKQQQGCSFRTVEGKDTNLRRDASLAHHVYHGPTLRFYLRHFRGCNSFAISLFTDVIYKSTL